jgi:hypothetical protein
VRSSLKAFEVAIDRYIEGTPKGNESCVEYCDKAVELILKAKVINTGESIYVKAGSTNTIKIHESFAKLRNKGIKIPEENKLLSNHKYRRNPTYHEGETVSRAYTKSVLKTSHEFIKRFLKDEFNLELKDVVKPRYYHEVLEHNVTGKRSAIVMIDEGDAELYRLDQARSKIPKEYESIEVLLNWLAKKKKLRLRRQQRQRQRLQQQQPSSLSKKNNNRSVRMSEIVDALIANGTLPKERRKDFDIIASYTTKLFNTREEITWDGGYDEYTTAVLRFKGYLELIEQAER